MKLWASELGGTLGGPDVEFDGTEVDSRRVRGGELFVAIVAGRDGHDFIGDALAAGAAAYVTEREPVSGAATSVRVPDTRAALLALGRLARDRLPDRLVGITGSTGKTSTKDLLGSILRGVGPCAVSERSFNNELGVPLTLANAQDAAQAAVVEMGARGPGHIRVLCGIARPTVGVVTNVSLAHTEFLGSLDGVAAAKSELVESLPASGTAVLNASDERVAAMASRTAAAVLTFGVGVGEVRATKVTTDGELRPSFHLQTPWGEEAVELEARGAHQAANAAAAAAAALALGVDLAGVVAGLEEAVLSPWRMEVRHSRRGVTVLNDVYNANPASMEAALHALADVSSARRRVAVLGPMLELGEHAEAAHARVAGLAASLGIDLVAVGTAAYGVDPVGGEADLDVRDLGVGSGDAVLVKGSRAAGLEHVVERLVAW